MKVRLGFAFQIQSGKDERYALLQAQSIRKYTGTHKHSPVFAMLPSEQTGKLNPGIVDELNKLDVEIIPFDYYTSKQSIHYTIKSMAAGAAELYATGKVEQLIYSDVESLFLNDPSLMALHKSKKLGIRPVDIKNIGSLWDEPLDDFWKNIYSLLNVSTDYLFPVISTVDSVKLRAYFNACQLTVKPEYGLLQKWSNNLARLRDNPVWNKYFAQNELYRVFLHQAIMVGTMLAELKEEDIEIQPVQVNFPLYAYPQHPHKPEWINDLISCRLDLLENDNCWKTWLPMQEPIKSWLIPYIETMNLDIP